MGSSDIPLSSSRPDATLRVLEERLVRDTIRFINEQREQNPGPFMERNEDRRMVLLRTAIRAFARQLSVTRPGLDRRTGRERHGSVGGGGVVTAHVGYSVDDRPELELEI